MTPLAVVKADRRTEGAPRLAPNHRHRGSHDQPLAANACAPASEALAENDAKDRKADSYAIPSRILKPNIYYKAHNFAPEPIGSELSRLGRANFRPGPTETSPRRNGPPAPAFR